MDGWVNGLPMDICSSVNMGVARLDVCTYSIYIFIIIGNHIDKYASTHVCIYGFMYVCVCVRVHVFMCICVNICMHVLMFGFTLV